jgi:cytochrome c biogenesis protein CcdA/thiol-disulfide isomerase/thioredoxin
MALLLFFAFLSGLVTILAPCIWPLLPIVLSSAASGKGKARPLGITLGIMLSFGFFTLAISFLVNAFHLDQNVLRMIAVVVLGFLGLTLLIPQLTQVLESVVSGLSGKWGQRWQKADSGQARTSFTGGFITGLSLGIVWAPCAGPIFASIAALSVMGHISLELVLITIVYVIGIGIPLFIFALAGQRLLQRSRVLTPYTARIQQVFGLIILLMSLAIYTNYDKVIEAKLLNLFPSYSNALTSFEKSQIVTQQLNSLKGKGSATQQNAAIASDTCQAIPLGSKMPEFTGITKWLNVSGQESKIPLTPFLKGENNQNSNQEISTASLKGKVVLVDFWTYTCINCIRTLPYVTSWYDKYKDKGFVVIGVHTPEFEFEKDTNNVLNAIKQYKIHYPVPQDNNYNTWNAYNNQYWPAEYLFDSNGMLRRAHCGEGEYDQMETAIVSLLKEAGDQAVLPSVMPTNYVLPNQISPETYLGSKRMEYYYPSGSVNNGTQNFTLTNAIPLNSFSYGGQWTIESEDAVSGKNAVLNYHFIADKVYIILRPPQGVANAKVKVLLDGKSIDSSIAGADVHNGIVTVDKDRLYHIVNLGSQTGEHTVQLEFQTPGTQAYTFTFG